MEGYFPVDQYCRLTGVSKDTAHHRAIRQTVKAFKEEKSGRWFIYFCDEVEPIPEGFIHVNEYAEKAGVHHQTIRRAVKCKCFSDDDYRYIRYMTKDGGHRRALYIRENTIYPNDPKVRNPKIARRLLDLLRPKGYLTVREFCDRENCTTYYVYNRIHNGPAMDSKNVEGHWYIHENVKLQKGDNHHGNQIRSEGSDC